MSTLRLEPSPASPAEQVSRSTKSSISEHTFPALGMAGTQDVLLYNPRGIPHDTHHHLPDPVHG